MAKNSIEHAADTVTLDVTAAALRRAARPTEAAMAEAMKATVTAVPFAAILDQMKQPQAEAPADFGVDLAVNMWLPIVTPIVYDAVKALIAKASESAAEELGKSAADILKNRLSAAFSERAPEDSVARVNRQIEARATAAGIDEAQITLMKVAVREALADSGRGNPE